MVRVGIPNPTPNTKDNRKDYLKTCSNRLFFYITIKGPSKHTCPVYPREVKDWNIEKIMYFTMDKALIFSSMCNDETEVRILKHKEYYLIINIEPFLLFIGLKDNSFSLNV